MSKSSQNIKLEIHPELKKKLDELAKMIEDLKKLIEEAEKKLPKEVTGEKK